MLAPPFLQDRCLDAKTLGRDPTMNTPHNEIIDRLAPARHPGRRAVMYQNWRSLLFLHWEVDPAALGPLLPPGLSLDLFEGRAYIGLVPFAMRDVRPAGLPAVPRLSNFLETNVRTYVHLGGRDPGVWFFSLDASNAVAVALARSLFSLPYHHARMALDDRPGGEIRYASERLAKAGPAATSEVRARPFGEPCPATPGSLDHFLLERYLLYVFRRGRLYSGQVHHTPYPSQNAEVLAVEETLVAAAGVARPDSAPLAHFARGVDVEIFPLKPAP